MDDKEKKELDAAIKEINSVLQEADKAREVDDVISEILNPEGAYSSEFSDKFSKYHGRVSPEMDESMGAAGLRKRDYSAEADEAIARRKAAESRISKKVDPDHRKTYDRETINAVRPEFTLDGGVRYPVYGVGESEQRVVYDADWEDEAKQKAAELERRRRSNMLRGDSEYARQQFMFTGAGKIARRDPVRSRLIDPLEEELDAGTREIYRAEDDEPASAPRESEAREEQKKSDDGKKSFFPEGFSEEQKNDSALSGKTGTDETDGSDGLTKEETQNIDSLVLSELSSELDGENVYKDEHWQEIVEQARKRKEQMEVDARREEALERSRRKLDKQKQRIAQLEDDIGKAPITDMDIFTVDKQKDKFTGINPEDEAENGIAFDSDVRHEKKATAYSPGVRFDSPAGFAVEAEKLSPGEAANLGRGAALGESKIKKG
ncbi:MAG: hypothetical protein IJS90_08475, partial [Clostridia bacterium]|nr:hypothetical protein [Clostridia bacterium]